MEEKKEHIGQGKINKRCCNCYFFNRYYTKGYCRFSKEDVGYCRKKESIKDKNTTCGEWRSNYIYTRHRGKVALRALNEILLNLNEIRQIIEEDKEIEKD